MGFGIAYVAAKVRQSPPSQSLDPETFESDLEPR